MLVIAAAFGLGRNALGPEPLPWTGTIGGPGEPEPGAGLPSVSAPEAAAAWEGGTFKVLSAEVEGSPVKVEVHLDDTGKQTVIRLLYTGEEPGTQGVRTLLVKTDDPDQPMIEVPVRYQTRAATTATQSSSGG
jgi:hypothetical protein